LSRAKEKYIAFLKDNYVPIFYRNEYLDVVCDVQWDVVLYEEEEQIKGAYIYMLKHKFLLKYIIQPQLCPYTGPLFFNTKDSNKAYSYLLESLPSHHLIIQDYFHDISIVDEFKHTQFKKHTYVINADVDVDDLWKNQSSTHRRIIRKAERELRHEVEESIDVFLEFVSNTFQKRSKEVPSDPTILKQLDKVLADLGQRKIVKCTNIKNEVVAMGYFMKDEKWTYNIASGVVESYKHYGMNLILWNEIKASLSEGKCFDFEGSMIPGVDEFFKRYKGKKSLYQSRNKSSNKFIDLLVKIKKMKSNI
jgi:hypothetical protein